MVKLTSWSQDLQDYDIQVECNLSWINIEGLPLCLLNFHVFKVIGGLCGGLIDVDKSTIELKFISHARLQLKGEENGFIRSSINLP